MKTNVLKDFDMDNLKETHVRLFSRLADAPDNERPLDDALLILCTPRCGSTLFAEAINNTGLMGLCEEWFNYEYFAAYCKVTGAAFDIYEYLNWVAKKTMRNTSIFCVKLHVGQLVAMCDDFNIGMESMDFRHIVYLCRRNKVAQAVSMVKAITTKQFRSYEKRQSVPEITNQKIAEALHTIIKFDEFTRTYLWKYVDTEYVYEDFCDLSNLTPYNATLDAFGLPPVDSVTAGNLKKQGDTSNIDMSHEFNRFITGL